MHTLAYGSGHYEIPPYWEAIFFGAVAIAALWAFFAFAGEKPLARRWKVLVVGLLLSLLSVGCVIEGNSVPYNPWTQVATGLPAAGQSYPPSPDWLNEGVLVLGILLLVLLARDYQWLTWTRLWFNAFVLNRPISEPPSGTQK